MGSFYSTANEPPNKSKPDSKASKKKRRKRKKKKSTRVSATAGNSTTMPLLYVGSPKSIPKLNMNSSSRYGVTGLYNLGNTCFMNSALQCLSHTTQLTKYFLENNWETEINRSNPLGLKGQLAKSFGSLIKNLWIKGDSRISPVQFKRSLSKFAPQFSGTLQHDSQELLAFLLDGLHEDLNRVLKKPYIAGIEGDGKKSDEEVSAKAWKNHLSRNKSIIVDLFQGQLKSTLTCLDCGRISITFDPLMYLSLPVPHSSSQYYGHRKNDNAISLKSCLNAFTAREKLKGNEKWYCDKCKNHVTAYKRIQLWKLPPVLMIHLKRFKCNKFGSRYKINDEIDIPIENLDFSDMLPNNSHQKSSSKYTLYAVSCHSGGLGGGHYTAQAYSPRYKTWFDYNDDRVTEIAMNHVRRCVKSSGYVLFYARSTCDDIRRQSLTAPSSWPHKLPDDKVMICGDDRTSRGCDTLPFRSSGIGNYDKFIINHKTTIHKDITTSDVSAVMLDSEELIRPYHLMRRYHNSNNSSSSNSSSSSSSISENDRYFGTNIKVSRNKKEEYRFINYERPTLTSGTPTGINSVSRVGTNESTSLDSYCNNMNSNNTENTNNYIKYKNNKKGRKKKNKNRINVKSINVDVVPKDDSLDDIPAASPTVVPRLNHTNTHSVIAPEAEQRAKQMAAVMRYNKDSPLIF